MNSRSVKRSVLTLALAALFAAGPAAAFKVVGYFPTWQGDVNSIPYGRMTHINYSFVLPTNSGGLQALEGGAARLNTLVSQAHAKNVKVLIAVGGWNDGDDSAFRSLAANSSYRANFVNNIVNFVNQYDLDGVDIDWEYPDAGAEANSFRLLMQDLSRALKPRGKLLTAAVTHNDWPGSVDSAVIEAVDFLNLMVYDLNYPHSTYQAAQAALTHWKFSEGLPKSKAVLGVPFYSRTNYIAYRDIIARYGAGAAQVDNAGGLDYNGQPTIKAKSELALNEAGGIMFWEISQDTRDNLSLMKTIWDTVGHAAGGGNGGDNDGGTPGDNYPDWNSNTYYAVGAIVRYEGKLYIAEHANPGYNPTISTWFWNPYTSTGGGNGGTPTYPEWRAGTQYAKGAVVRFNGRLYIAEHANPGYDPTISTWYWDPYTPAPGVDPGLVWKRANLTNYTSYPDPGSDECVNYNGCMWAGYFAFLNGKQSPDWVSANNIAAVHSKDAGAYKLKTLRLRQGSKSIDVKVYDMCSDSDCNGCCTANSRETGFLIDIEKHTMDRFGAGSGVVEWSCLDCK
ncbi:MAG: hypothetical protein CME36_14685 [unclassified Hahellaceae]|nr:hypothetical protein [Hahellaceae bacterium]|tara:strand:+ start:1016 stop:2707 length:1692 start_codon:yes stop_codon:yes gene_type:complete